MVSPLVVRVAVVSVLAALGVAAAPDATPDLGLSGTKHDFTLLGLSEAQKCTVCHTPSASDGSSEVSTDVRPRLSSPRMVRVMAVREA